MADFTDLQPVTKRIEFPSDITAEEFFEYCAAYRHLGLQIERNPDGSIVMEPPVGYESDYHELELGFALKMWNRSQSELQGYVSGSNAGFVLPNGSVRSPDAAWTSREKLKAFSAEDFKKFLPVCPEFVAEVRSPTDNLKKTQAKMQEWIENGALLAWLIDPIQEKAWIYRAESSVEEVSGFDNQLSGENVLPGFVFDLQLLRFPL